MGGDPNQSPLVSCCLIVRDEVEHLTACVEVASPLVDDWLVYDTGSSDGTVELARALGCRVIEGEWRDDFAWARNQVLAEARGEWILVLDADERLQDGAELLAFLAAGPEADALFLPVESPLGPPESEAVERGWQARVFRTCAGIRYRYPVHEVPVLDGLRAGPGPGRILHLGYLDPAVRERKARRMLELLARLPEDSVHRHYHALRAAMVLQDWDRVLEASGRLQGLAVPTAPDVLTFTALALMARGRTGEAIRLLAEGTARHPDHPDLYYGLLTAAGIRYVETTAALDRDGGFGLGPVATQASAPAIAAALVGMGVFEPALLDSPLVRGRGADDMSRPGGREPVRRDPPSGSGGTPPRGGYEDGATPA